MSDSDDTDLLLLIPPDFFLVQTADLCDNSEDGYGLESHHQLVEPSVVNDLITHVNELESRICVIENLDSLQLPTSDNNTLDLNQSLSESSSHQSKSWLKQTNASIMSNLVPTLRGNIDGIQHHYLKSRNDFVSPPKSRQPFSLPSTPTCGEYNRSEFYSSQLNGKEANHQNLSIQLENYKGEKCINNKGSEILRTNDKQSNFTDSAVHDQNETSISNTKVIPEVKELLGEIDQYLNDVVRHGGIFQNKDEKLHTYPITSYQSDKGMSIENNFQIMDENSDSPTSNQTRLDLPEVDKLLKEMEATQNEIEQKLKLHNPSKRILNTSLDDILYSDQIRDKTNSLPNTGFSLIEVYSSNSKKNTDVSNGRTNPLVIKESFIKRNMFPSSRKDNKTESSVINMTDSSIHDRRSPASRRKLDMDFKYKGIDKQSPLTSNFKSHDQNTKKITKPVGDIANTENNMSLKSARVVESQSQEQSIHKHFSPTKFNMSKHVGLESLREQFNSERDRRYLLQSQETTKFATSQKGIFNAENNHNISARIKGNDVECYQKSNDEIQQAYGNIPLNHGKQPIESSVVHPLEQQPSSTNLLSLTDLWNKEPIFHSNDPNKLKQKLEEEKYRRQHCEEMIQNLQYRILEEQEKLAVAVRVDKEKDNAIIQLTEAWRKLAKHWEELEEQRHSLAQQLQIEKELNKSKVEEMTKKINLCETEVAQALDLAAGYKEKYEVMTRERDDLKQNLQSRIEDAEKQVEAVSEQNQQFLKERNEVKQQIEQYRRKNEESKQTIKETQIELAEAKQKLSQCEAEINVLMEQKEALSEKLKDERAHSNTLEQQKLALQQALDEAKKREKTAGEEAHRYGERIEVARTELRTLYQGQLEAVVRDKLREFQNQLDAAEAALKAELEAREKSWAEKANNQCELLIERHKTELQQIQSQHREELKTWKMKVIDCERLKSAIQSQLQEEADRRTDIAQRLHNVMETQWRQALKIITNPNAVENNSNPTSHFKHEIKSMQHQGGEINHNVRLDLKDVHYQGSAVASVTRSEDFPFVEEGKATYRLANTQPQQDHLKKYIQMLLDRAPGNPVDDREHSGLWHDLIPGNRPLSPGSGFGGKWSAFMPLQDDKNTNSPVENLPITVGQNHNKPPWK